MSAEPAALPGLRAARTLYAALHGEFAPHPHPALSQDAYSLFYARSAAMGWLTPASEGAATFEGGPGGGHHRVTFRATLAEWSLDALGWLAAFLADVSARHGVRTPLTLTADRAAG